MSYDSFQAYGLDAVTILAEQEWTDALDDGAYHEALVSVVSYLSHSAAE